MGGVGGKQPQTHFLLKIPLPPQSVLLQPPQAAPLPHRRLPRRVPPPLRLSCLHGGGGGKKCILLRSITPKPIVFCFFFLFSPPLALPFSASSRSAAPRGRRSGPTAAPPGPSSPLPSRLCPARCHGLRWEGGGGQSQFWVSIWGGTPSNPPVLGEQDPSGEGSGVVKGKTFQSGKGMIPV